MPNESASGSALAALLETLVPASEDGEMPSASEVGFDAHLVTDGQDFAPEVAGILAELGDGFADLSAEARHETVKQWSATDPVRFAGLLARVYDVYYQDDRVREKIGVVRGPVFPQGNEIVQGDLSLLDPVIENSDRHRYRRP